MRTHLIAGLALGALGIVAAACSSSSSGQNPYQKQSDFCTAVAKAECLEAPNCGVDPTQCETWRTSQCNRGIVIVPLTPPSDTLSRTYTPDKAKASVDALNGAFGNAQIKYQPDLQKLIDTCEAVFAGNAGNGATCTSNYDCTQNGEICASVPGQAQAACATPTMKQQGSVCADPGDQCATGNYCSNASGTPKCVAAGTSGGPCMANDQCAGNTLHCANNACAARVMAGGSCSSNDDCDPSAPYCDPDVDKCAVGLGFLNGSFDCNGFLLGQNLPDGGPTVGDSGGGNDGGTMEAATGDAPSGG
jgi:hypothetical protein